MNVLETHVKMAVYAQMELTSILAHAYLVMMEMTVKTVSILLVYLYLSKQMTVEIVSILLIHLYLSK
jgi:hypothetical protein